MFDIQAYIVVLSAMAAPITEYALLEGSWSIDVERTLSLAVPESIDASARNRFKRSVTGAKLQFRDGLLSRVLASGEVAGPTPYSIRPISDTEFEIAGPQTEAVMIATELSEETLCVRYLAPASSEATESSFAVECFLRDDA